MLSHSEEFPEQKKNTYSILLSLQEPHMSISSRDSLSLSAFLTPPWQTTKHFLFVRDIRNANFTSIRHAVVDIIMEMQRTKSRDLNANLTTTAEDFGILKQFIKVIVTIEATGL